MWPLLLDFAVPIATLGISKLMEDDDLDENLEKYLEDLEYKVQTLEKKVKTLQICFLASGILFSIGTILYFLK